MRVEELMSMDLATFSKNDSISEASRRLSSRKSKWGLVTTSQGNLEGILTEQDILAKCLSQWHDPRLCQVTHHMTTNFVTVQFGADIGEAWELMQSEKVEDLPVILGNKVVGLISLANLDSSFVRLSTKFFESLSSYASASNAAKKSMQANRIRKASQAA